MLTSTRRSISYPNPDRSDRPDIPTHTLNLVNALEVDVVYVQGTDAARLAAAHMAGVIWRATDTGLFWWDTGSTWLSLGTSTATVEADVHRAGTIGTRPAANAVNPGVMYFATDTGLTYRSDGATWTLVASTPAGEVGTGTIGARPGAATVPAGYIYFATDTGLAYRSDGANWVLMSAAAGAELDYAQITANPALVTATTEGTSVAQITGTSITYDGTKVKFEVYVPKWTQGGAGISATYVLYRDSTVVTDVTLGSSDNGLGPRKFEIFDTPTAGPHTYGVKAFASAASGITTNAGTGGSGAIGPAWMRITKA